MTLGGLTVLHRGEGFLAIDKPAGALVIPGRAGAANAEAPSLCERLEQELQQKIYVVHRLDRDTSGALLFALEPSKHRELSMAFEAGQIKKTYLALVRGAISAPLQLQSALVPARRGRMRVARAGELGKPALTSVRPLELFSEVTLIEVTPLTGRTHQIRVHLASAGHPLLVDPQYGSDAPWSAGAGVELTRTPLHAASLELPSGERIDAPLPSDLKSALGALRGRR